MWVSAPTVRVGRLRLQIPMHFFRLSLDMPEELWAVLVMMQHVELEDVPTAWMARPTHHVQIRGTFALVALIQLMQSTDAKTDA
jgi:hypothetical protein